MSETDLFKAIQFADETAESGELELLEIDETKPVVEPDAEKKQQVKTDEIDIDINVDELNKDKSEEKDKDLPPVNQSSSPFSSLAKAFADRGYFPNEEKTLEDFKDVKTFEEFTEILDKKSKLISEDLLSDNQKEYLEAMKAGIPHDDFHAYNVAVTTLEALTDTQIDENKAVQEDLIKQYYGIKLKSMEEAAPIAKTMMAQENAATAAKKAKEALIGYNRGLMKLQTEKGKEKQNLEVEKEKTKLEDVKNFISEKELFPKLKMTDVQKEKVINAAVKVVGETTTGAPLNAVMKEMSENPVETNAKLAYLWVQTNGFKNLSGFSNTAMTDATRAVEEIASRSLTGGITDTPELNRQATKKGKELTDVVRLALNS